MKKIITLLCLVVLYSPLFAQTYYNMWRGTGTSGQPEWIANLALAYSSTGIQYTVANRMCGFANGYGRWYFIDPQESVLSLQNFNIWNDNLNANPHLAVATHGYMASSRWMLMSLNLSSGTDGFIGYGRANEMTISNQMSSLLRINSYGGIGFWGNGLAADDDSPSFEVKGTEVNTYIPLNYKDATTRNMLASLSKGRNSDVLFSSQANKMFRVSIPSGSLGIWLDGNASSNDTPTFGLGQNSMTLRVPLFYNNGNISFSLKNNPSNDALWLGTTSNSGMAIGINNTTVAFIDNTYNNLYWGFNMTSMNQIRNSLKERFGLFVKKGILSADYCIAPVSTWSDYVFNDNYELISLEELDQFIEKERHLPGVPTQKEISEDGYSQHEMNTILLKKIEELTLYILKQQEEISLLKKQIVDINK